MKRTWLAAVLAVCLLAAAVPVRGQAETSPEEKIQEACKYGITVDLSEFRLSEEELKTCFTRMLEEGKLPWYVAHTYNYTYQESGGEKRIMEFSPDLLDDSYDRMAYEEKVAEILAEVPLEGMEDWQIALAIHDELALRSAYDETLQKSTGYDLLVNGTTICAGYAELYQALLLKMGIPCLQVESVAMNHAWNLVQIDGQWYHVDVTWDDPVSDVQGRVLHDHFLRTDEEMKNAEKPYYDWNAPVSCTDTRFSKGFWLDVIGPILFTDSNTCFYLKESKSRNSLYRRDVSKNKETRIYQEPDSYLDLGQGKYRYSHTGLSLREGRLWLCSMDQVISMKPDGKNQKTEFSYNAEKQKKYLGGCFVKGDSLYLTLVDHQGSGVVQVENLPESDAHQHAYTRTVVQATCSVEGYTESVCQCGLRAVGAPVKTGDHRWQKQEDSDLLRCADCGETKVEEKAWPEKVLPWAAVGGGVLVLLILIGALSKRKKKAKRRSYEEM